jgi:hypothetical protein
MEVTNMERFKLIFGGLIAYILLGFYVYSTVYAMQALYCLLQPGCTAYSKDLTAGFVDVLSVIGGLVSALVVAELAVTKPGEMPGARLQSGAGPRNQWISAVIIVYMVVWLGVGVFTFVVGLMQHPDVVPALTSSAKSWFGIAVATVYAYFGVKPK